MDRLDAMALLVAVVDRGSLSAASRALQVPLATLSRRLSDLEALLGTRLLLRTTRRLSLTEAGTAYLAAARRILEQVADAEREAAGEFTQPMGDLVLTAPVMFGRLHLLPVVADFLAAHPLIRVRLLLADGNLDLLDNQVDLAVRIGHLPDSTMVATAVGTMRQVVCASPALLAAQGTPAGPDDLRRLPCVAVDPTSTLAMGATVPPAPWRFRHPRTGAAIDLPIAPRLVVSSSEAAVQAAIRQVGLARLLHYQVQDAVASGALAIVLRSHELPPVPVHLLHASPGRMQQKMRRFLDFAAPRLREALAGIAAADDAAAPLRA